MQGGYGMGAPGGFMDIPMHLMSHMEETLMSFSRVSSLMQMSVQSIQIGVQSLFALFANSAILKLETKGSVFRPVQLLNVIYLKLRRAVLTLWRRIHHMPANDDDDEDDDLNGNNKHLGAWSWLVSFIVGGLAVAIVRKLVHRLASIFAFSSPHSSPSDVMLRQAWGDGERHSSWLSWFFVYSAGLWVLSYIVIKPPPPDPFDPNNNNMNMLNHDPNSQMMMQGFPPPHMQSYGNMGMAGGLSPMGGMY